MALKNKILLILTAVASIPFILAAFLGAVHFSIASVLLVVAASAAMIYGFFLLFVDRLIRPLDKMLGGIRGFLGSDYRLDAVMPSAGWPELKRLTGDLNRMMLELQAFRAFHLDRIMEEKNKAQALIDAISDGLVLMDDQGGMIYSNQAALDLLGIPGLAPGADIPGSITNAPFLAEFTSILAGSEQYTKSDITAPCRPAGDKASMSRIYRITASRFFLSTLKRRGCVVILRDVTSEKEREKERDAFFHMITHDMRSPLATIQGYAEIIKKKVGPSSGTETFFQNMLYSARRLGGMIDDILNINKLRSGSLVPILSSVSANDLIIKISEQQAPVTGPKRITVSCETSSQFPRFQGDSALLERALANIAAISIRSTRVGGSIVFGTEQDDENVIFWIRSTGTVLSEESRRTLFDEYPVGGIYSGQGLGLAMAQKTVQLHNGRVWVEADADKGNRFIMMVSKRPSLGA